MFKRPILTICLLFLSLLFLADQTGLAHFRTGNPPEAYAPFLNSDQPVRILGEVFRQKENDRAQSLILSHVLLITPDGHRKIPDLKASVSKQEAFPPGSLLLLSGFLRDIEGPRNPGEFDFKIYYAAQNVFYSLEQAKVLRAEESPSILRRRILSLRARLAGVLKRTAGEDAGIFTAAALGDKSGLSPETSLLFQLSGIFHILSISGLHVGMLGIAFRSLLRKAGAGVSASLLIPLILLILYGMLTGNALSVLRALMMYLISSFGLLTGRIYDQKSALSLTALLLLLERPACMYDSSFLLSFSAIAGISWIFPVLSRAFPEKKASGGHRFPLGKGKLRQSLLLSFSVFLASLPVTEYFSGEISPMGPFLNLLAVPCSGILLSSAFLSMLSGSLHILSGKAAALPGRAALAVLTGAAKLVSRLPFASIITGRPSPARILCYYLLLLAFLLVLSHEKPAAGKKSLRLPALAVFAAFSSVLLLHHPVPLFSITCLDVGQGDCTVIRTPRNHVYLIDGGSSDKNSPARYILLPYLRSQGISRIDAIFLTHTDGDHCSAVLELLRYMEQDLTKLTVDALILPDWKDPPPAYLSLTSAAKAAGVPVTGAFRGERFSTGELDFRVLSPEAGLPAPDVNECGLVLMASCREFSSLFPGDIGQETEEVLKNKGLLSDVDFLKVPHHGSRYSSGEAFLSALSPEIGVISCSRQNSYGHPAPEAVKRLEDAGCQVEYTMKSGAVAVFFEKGRIYVRRTVSSRDF